jgi:hypothetical protein
MNEKAQSVIEFSIIIGVVFFFFIVFLAVIGENITGKVVESRDVALKEVAFTVIDEINLAVNGGDGYYRKFILPERVVSEEYEISIEDGQVYARTLDGNQALAMPVEEVQGNPVPGVNIIRNIDGVALLNEG